MNTKVKVSKNLVLNALLLNRINDIQTIIINLSSSSSMFFFNIYLAPSTLIYQNSESTKLKFNHVKTDSMVDGADAIVDGQKVPLYLGGNLTYNVLSYWHDSKATKRPLLALNHLRLFKGFDLNSNFLIKVNNMLTKFFASHKFVAYHMRYLRHLESRNKLLKKRNDYLTKAKSIDKELGKN